MGSPSVPFAACAVICLGCGNHHQPGKNPDASSTDATTDAYMPSPCWLDTYNTSGSVELGTGIFTFEAMPSMVPLEYGTQSAGYDMPTQARISGLDPGDPNNTLDPKNPRTRFHAWFTDTTPPTVIQDVNCGVRIGYLPSPGGGGTFDMSHGGVIIFPNNLTGSDIFGRPINIVLEVIDGNDNYAMTQQTVMGVAPAGGGD